jgi:intergrase/recombinase
VGYRLAGAAGTCRAGTPAIHHLRHTVITELAELGIADHVLESISGHLSRRMLEHYSHIRIDAKRQALDALDAPRRGTDRWRQRD